MAADSRSHILHRDAAVDRAYLPSQAFPNTTKVQYQVASFVLLLPQAPYYDLELFKSIHIRMPDAALACVIYLKAAIRIMQPTNPPNYTAQPNFPSQPCHCGLKDHSFLSLSSSSTVPLSLPLSLPVPLPLPLPLPFDFVFLFFFRGALSLSLPLPLLLPLLLLPLSDSDDDPLELLPELDPLLLPLLDEDEEDEEELLPPLFFEDFRPLLPFGVGAFRFFAPRPLIRSSGLKVAALPAPSSSSSESAADACACLCGRGYRYNAHNM